MSKLSGEFQGTQRYQVRRRLGAGGMGVVYDAYDRERDRRVALKALIHADASGIYRLKREFRTLADVVHPNLVTLYELVAEDDEWFFTMELVEGVSFLDWVRPAPESDALEEGRLRRALRELALGVRALHAAGKAHRDLKPSNILVTFEGRVVILDFGIAHELVAPGDVHTSTETGLLGTAHYMAPEQVAGITAGAASDWYAVGVILYEALTGRLPFAGNTMSVMLQKQRTDPPPPDALTPDLPRDLVDLCTGLLVRDPIKRLDGGELLRRLGGGEDLSAAPLLARHQTTLVGRRTHFAALEAAFEATKRGAPVSVYLHGPSGMGKSTIAEAFAEHATIHGAVVLAGKCYERESVPYKALDGVVDSLTKYLRGLPEERVEALMPRDVLALARLFPVLQRVDAVADAPRRALDVPDPLELRRRAVGALRELLSRIADRHPLLVWIDDLQWADADSTALLDDLLRPPEPPLLLLIASFRSEEIASKPFLAQLVARADGDTRRELAVGRLAPEEADALAADLLEPAMPEARPFVETIVREAQGSPFFLEQLARFVLESEGVPVTGAGLTDMLDARIARLPEGARAFLETLAVAGRPVAFDVAHTAAGLAGDARPLITSLRGAHLVKPSGTTDGVEIYHDRIREALAGRLRTSQIKWVHLRLAGALTDRGIDDPEALFEHLVGADDRDRAAVQAVSAARRAAEALAFDRAARFYRQAVELAPEGPDGHDLVQLHAALGEALANAGRPAEAAEAFLTAASALGTRHSALGGVEGPSAERRWPSPDSRVPKTALDYQRRAAEQLLIGGHNDQGLAVIRQLLGAVGLGMPRGPKRALLSLLAHRAQLALRTAVKRGLTYRERPAEEIAEGDLLRIDVCWACAVGLTLVDFIVAADFQTRYLLMALDAGEPFRVARGLALEVGFTAAKGGPSRRETDRLVAQAGALAERLGSPREQGLAAMTAGSAAFLRGEWKRAAEMCAHAEQLLRERCTGVLWELTTSQTFLMSSLVYLGELGEVTRRLPAVLAAAQERGNLLAATEMRTRQHIGWLAMDQAGEARRQVGEALTRWSHTGFHRQHYNSLLALTNIDLYDGDAAAAWQRLEEQWPRLTTSMLPRIQVLRAEATHLRARGALAASGSGPLPPSAREEMLAIAERSATRLARERMPWTEPLVPLVRAGVAARRGDAAGAAELLAAAATGLDAADMRLHAAAARRALGELVGGERGRKLVEDADALMRAQSVKQPERLARVLAPGFA